MRKLMLVMAGALVFAPTAVAQPAQNANERATVKTCKNLKAQMGARNFNSVFAPRTQNARAALRNCARSEGAALRRNRVTAAHTCKTWRNDPDAFAAAMQGTPNEGRTFAQVFGTGPNAYGKCVSWVATTKARERRAALVNAARTCALWRRDADAFAEAMRGTPNEGRTFAQVFGTGPNAYGKCVSQQRKASNQTP